MQTAPTMSRKPKLILPVMLKESQHDRGPAAGVLKKQLAKVSQNPVTNCPYGQMQCFGETGRGAPNTCSLAAWRSCCIRWVITSLGFGVGNGHKNYFENWQECTNVSALLASSCFKGWVFVCLTW